ncbi:conserved hypothetical protein [Theileria equi strain WA]|uniref:Signal peptide-containing protein n=1 Tax=Theileria equi strain WA TaxID=1537102 RepID=L1LGD3_THEEQ|nr:conserved hypothetical protein [Theileria equi strain WA]EKX74421.1 conserved hypothetical protein [Theileria equi strain WA]|eukprot:XP_004833873.1 conserved hypothetical protein [Theileria equi strain WA]
MNIVSGALYLYVCICTVVYGKAKIPITLDTSIAVSTEHILKTIKYKSWSTFRIIDDDKRIGEVRNGPIPVKDEGDSNIIERVVYQKRIDDKLIIRIVSEYENGSVSTEEFAIGNQESRHCSKIVREGIPLDLKAENFQNEYIQTSLVYPQWKEFKVRKKYALEYKITSVYDGEVRVLEDEDPNIRVRYVHKLQLGTWEKFQKACLPVLAYRNPTIVRIYTYFEDKRRRFDEFVEDFTRGVRSYKELVRSPVMLDLSKENNGFIKRYKTAKGMSGYKIASNYKNSMRIGAVVNGPIVVAEDRHDIRIRVVYTEYGDATFEWVDVKTCYKHDECKKCRYVLDNDHYVESLCNEDGSKNMEDSTISIGNPFNSTDNLLDSSILTTLVKRQLQDDPMGVIESTDRLDAVEGEPKTSKEIIINVANATVVKDVTLDLLHNANGLYYSINSELIGKPVTLKIMNGHTVVTKVKLAKTKAVEFLVKMGEDGRKRVFMWIHQGEEFYDCHEILLINPSKDTAKYKKKFLPIETRIN